ncbi:MAG: hypothetical protein BGO69_08910 [Bacteroidetes bacterium 46-16]|nr:MAG: hypothetical protein BGO69_08910 [Bacteroidetes bacterium 46-16]
MMFYDGYHFWGMHLIWWFFWVVMLSSLFGWFEPVPKKKITRDTPLDILKRRLASGEISAEEYGEKKRLLEQEK